METETQESQSPISNVPESQQAPEPVDLEQISAVSLPSKVTFLDPGELVIDPDRDPRRYNVNAAKIIELAQDIAKRGQLQPVLARKIKGDIVVSDGRNRVRAIAYANEHELTAEPVKVAVIIADMGELESFLSSVSANLKRNDMSPVDHANIILTLSNEYGMRKKDIAKVIGKGASTVTELSQIGELRPSIQKKIHEGAIPYTVAIMLHGMDEDEQDSHIAEIEKGGAASKRDTVRAKKRAKNRAKKGGDASVSLTMREIRGGFESLAGVGNDQEEGKECKYSEEVQGVFLLVLKFLDGKLGEKALSNQIEKLLK